MTGYPVNPIFRDMTNPAAAPVVLSAREIEVLYSALGTYISDWEGVTEDANIRDASTLRERLRPLLPSCYAQSSCETTEGEEAPESEEPGFSDDDGQPSSWDERRDFAGDDDYGGSSFDDGCDW